MIHHPLLVALDTESEPFLFLDVYFWILCILHGDVNKDPLPSSGFRVYCRGIYWPLQGYSKIDYFKGTPRVFYHAVLDSFDIAGDFITLFWKLTLDILRNHLLENFVGFSTGTYHFFLESLHTTWGYIGHIGSLKLPIGNILPFSGCFGYCMDIKDRMQISIYSAWTFRLLWPRFEKPECTGSH